MSKVHNFTKTLKNLSSDTLSDVHVALGTSSLFSAFDDCGVNGTSGSDYYKRTY